KRVPTGAAFAFAAFLIITAIVSFVRDRFRDNRPDDASSSKVAEHADPLRIGTLEIQLLEHVDDRRTTPRGRLGFESFSATPDDDIRVTAVISRPAFCYLIVFRPDGKDEVLYPQGANDLPALTDEPRYPSKDRTKVYGLSDGTGLWLVALVASEKPLQ